MKKFKKFLITLAAVLLLGSTLSGCNADGEYMNSDLDYTDARFQRVYEQDNPDTRIYVDKETKVMYVFVKSGYGGGLTIMVDEDGKPLLWEEGFTDD